MCSTGFDPAHYPTLDGMLFRPVSAGLWQHRETFDGTYDIEDLIDIHEFLDVKEENQRRYDQWQESVKGQHHG